MKGGRFQLDVWKRVVRYWNRFPRKVADAQNLAFPKLLFRDKILHKEKFPLFMQT